MLTLLMATAVAGDPCPIDLVMAEYTPQWRDRAQDLAGWTSKQAWLVHTRRSAACRPAPW